VKAYVVSSCWLREGSVVIGAATDLDGARVIANRWREEDPEDPPMWAAWNDEVEPAEGSVKWIRYRARTDGTSEPYEWQEIVVVPLADEHYTWSPTRSPGLIRPEVLSRGVSEITEIGRDFGAP
jgi:hypothetical protein